MKVSRAESQLTALFFGSFGSWSEVQLDYDGRIGIFAQDARFLGGRIRGLDPSKFMWTIKEFQMDSGGGKCALIQKLALRIL